MDYLFVAQYIVEAKQIMDDANNYRVITPDSADYPHNALHVYRLNADVDRRNSFMWNSLAPEE